MIRVLQVIEATIGGTRRHLSQLVGHLTDHGVEVTVACSCRRTDDFRRDMAAMTSAGITVHEVPMAREVSPAADLRARRTLATLIRQGGFEVVHSHSSKAGALARSATPSPGPALVHTPHSFAFLHDAEFSSLKRHLYLTIERRLGRRTDRVVAVSRAEAAATLNHRIVPRERLQVIHNGIEADLAARRAPELVRSELGVAEDAQLIVTVGLLELAKGHRHLIEALRRSADRLPDLRALIVGEGSLRSELEEQVGRAALGQRVVFTGHRGDAIDLIAAADALVLPSLWEGLPYVILEAMALGVPVISSDVGGCGELIEHGRTGLLVPAADPEALAAALAEVLGDRSQAAAMGRTGRRRVHAEFGLDAMVNAHAALYEALA